MPNRLEAADIVIVGAGVSGCAIARQLARHRLRIVVLEKGADVCSGASKGNGGGVHGGIDPKPGSLMARLNPRGNALYETWAAELNFEFSRPGSLMVARTEADLPALEKKLANGRANGVPGVRLVDREEMQRLEPNVSGLRGLLCPSMGMLNPQRTVIAMAENAAANGVAFHVGAPCTGIAKAGGKVTGVETPAGVIPTRMVINAAGLYADEVAEWAGVRDFTIRPRRGEYYILDKLPDLVRRFIFPVPDVRRKSKGICVVPTVDGNVLLGPNAEEPWEGTEADCRAWTETTEAARREILEVTRELVPSVPWGKLITAFAGLRPASDTGDFVIGPTALDGFINVAGIQSPGLASAPAIAEYVDEMVRDFLKPEPNAAWDRVRPAPVRFAEADDETRARLIAEDPAWGRIVCRCETVSEREVMEAIHRTPGGRTVEGLKFRTRAGSGRCQGGFCSWRIARILARETETRMEEVTLNAPEARLYAGDSRPEATCVDDRKRT